MNGGAAAYAVILAQATKASGVKGIAFFAKSTDAFELPRNAEVVVAQKIWIPD